MSKVRVPIAGTIGKSVQFDPQAGARAEAAVAALAEQIAAGNGGNIFHRNLLNLQVGDDHPQYTGNQFPETITGQWNFETIPRIQGETLAEYIEEVVGGSFFDFLQDTTSVVWTYFDTAGELEANVPPEFVQDTVGAMLTNTSSITLAYNDGAGTFNASIVDEYIQDLVDALVIDSTSVAWTYSDVGGTLSAATINANPSGLIGMSAVNGTALTPLRSDGRHAIDPAIAPEWTGTHGWADNAEIQLGTGNDLRLYHDGTDSYIRNDTGTLRMQNSLIVASRDTAAPDSAWLSSDAIFVGFKNSAGAAVNIASPNGGNVGFRGYCAQGGIGALSPVTTANAYLFFLGGAGYNGSGWSGSAGLFGIRPGSTWSSTNQEAYAVIEATPNGSTSRTEVGRFDGDNTARNTRLMVYDVDNGTLERVSVGVADSGGAGFKVLRIPN